MLSIINKEEDDADHFGKIVANFLRKFEPKEQIMARIKFEQVMLEFGN
jgi:hypothetical protein